MKCALVLFDRFGKEMVVTLCDDRETAKNELVNWYRKELVNAQDIDFKSTYIADDKAVIDEIFKIKEARISHIKQNRRNKI